MSTSPAPGKRRLQGQIERVSIHGFRSLAQVDDLQLPALTVLIGSNGAGKSNFIRFFEMLGWMMHAQKLQAFIQEQGYGNDQLFMGSRRTPRMWAEIRIRTDLGLNDYRFGLTHVGAGDTLILDEEAYRYSDTARKTQAQWSQLPAGTREAGLVEAAQNPKNKTARVLVHLLKQCITYQFHDTSSKAYIKQPWDQGDNVRLRSDGANLAPVLLRLQQEDIQRYKTIVRQVARVLPGFADFELQPAFGKVALRWRGTYGDKTFGAHLTSDGSLRLFCLLTLLNLSPDALPDVLFIDEPELGLHPHAVALVAEMLKKLSHTRQVFIATQSPYLVDCFELENIIVADIKDGATSLRNMAREKYQEWLDDDYLLSDLWLKNVVGAAP